MASALGKAKNSCIPQKLKSLEETLLCQMSCMEECRMSFKAKQHQTIFKTSILFSSHKRKNTYYRVNVQVDTQVNLQEKLKDSNKLNAFVFTTL